MYIAALESNIPDYFKMGKMPITSSLLSMFFYEVQSHGLLSNVIYPRNNEEFISLTKERLFTAMSKFYIAESNFQARLKISDIPYLYNFGSWDQQHGLGGYTTEDLGLRATQMCMTFLLTWSENMSFAYTKSSLWYMKERKSFKDGFEYFLNLLSAGFVTDKDQFLRTGWELVNLYAALDDPLKFIDKLVIDANSSNSKPMFEALWHPIFQMEKKEDRLQNIYSFLSNWIINRLSKAKNASNPIEFLVLSAEISILYELLNRVTKIEKSKLNLSLSDETFLSYLNEFHADFGTALLDMGLLSYDRSFPMIYRFPIWAYEVVQMYFGTYQDEPIERFFEDRFLVPNKLKETFKQSIRKGGYRLEHIDDTMPDDWKYISFIHAHSIGLAKNIDILRMRTQLIDREILENEIFELFGNINLSREDIHQVIKVYGPNGIVFSERAEMGEDQVRIEDKSDIQTKDKEYIKNHFYEIYCLVCDQELKKAFGLISQGYDQCSPKQLEEIKSQLLALSKLYPWNSSIYYQLSVVCKDLDDIYNTTEFIKIATFLDPENQLYWEFIQSICLSQGNQNDYVFASLVIQHLITVESRQNRVKDLSRGRVT